MRYAFEVKDINTGRHLGGVCYDDGQFPDSEAAFAATAEWAETMYGPNTHVEEISPEEHDAALGRIYEEDIET